MSATRLVQFQAMQRGDYFCIYALDADGQLWEREIALPMEDRPELAVWRMIPNPKRTAPAVKP